jgi:hypothetical protein
MYSYSFESMYLCMNACMYAGIDDERMMERAVEMLVSKAQMEEHFCFMYADLARKMTDTWSAGMYACMYACTYVCMHASMYAYIDVCMHRHMYYIDICMVCVRA